MFPSSRQICGMLRISQLRLLKHFFARKTPHLHDSVNYAHQWFTQKKRTPISQDAFEEQKAIFRDLYEIDF